MKLSVLTLLVGTTLGAGGVVVLSNEEMTWVKMAYQRELAASKAQRPVFSIGPANMPTIITTPLVIQSAGDDAGSPHEHCWHYSNMQHAVPNHEDEVCCHCGTPRCVNHPPPDMSGHGKWAPR